MGSPHLVILPFMMHDSWLFNKAFIHLINVLPNPYFFQAKVKNWLITESKAFWMSTVTNIPFKFNTSLICKTSAIKYQPSLMNLISGLIIWEKHSWDVLIKFWKLFLRQLSIEKLASTFDLIFYLCLFFS